MSTEKLDNHTNLIYVTGFGPFKGHEKVNASWEAVRTLPLQGSVGDIQYQLKLRQIPVIYDDVNQAVVEIWKENPKLVVHCGVYGKCDGDKILVEKQAYNQNFCQPDFSGKCLNCAEIPLNSNKTNCNITTLTTNFDVDEMVQELNADIACKCVYLASTKVGNYLCGYIYLKSLDINPDRTIFIHVPPVDAPYSSADTSKAILAVIEKCIQQLHIKNAL